MGRSNAILTNGNSRSLATATRAPVCSGGSEPWTGRQSFVIVVCDAERTGQRASVGQRGRSRRSPAVVATRSVARGNVITAADVELRMVEPSAKMSGSRVHCR